MISITFQHGVAIAALDLRGHRHLRLLRRHRRHHLVPCMYMPYHAIKEMSLNRTLNLFLPIKSETIYLLYIIIIVAVCTSFM